MAIYVQKPAEGLSGRYVAFPPRLSHECAAADLPTLFATAYFINVGK